MKSPFLYLVPVALFATHSLLAHADHDPALCPNLNGAWECQLKVADDDIEERVGPFVVKTEYDGETPTYNLLGFGPYPADGRTVVTEGNGSKIVTSCPALGRIDFKSPEGSRQTYQSSLVTRNNGKYFTYTIQKKIGPTWETAQTYNCSRKLRLPNQ